MAPLSLDTEVPASVCPYCDKVLDMATGLDDAVPSPGDITVCISCAQFLVFDTGLKLRKPFSGELEEMRAASPTGTRQMDKMAEIVRKIDRRKM